MIASFSQIEKVSDEALGKLFLPSVDALSLSFIFSSI